MTDDDDRFLFYINLIFGVAVLGGTSACFVTGAWLAVRTLVTT